jgi:hypothetical protein
MRLLRRALRPVGLTFVTSIFCICICICICIWVGHAARWHLGSQNAVMWHRAHRFTVEAPQTAQHRAVAAESSGTAIRGAAAASTFTIATHTSRRRRCRGSTPTPQLKSPKYLLPHPCTRSRSRPRRAPPPPPPLTNRNRRRARPTRRAGTWGRSTTRAELCAAESAQLRAKLRPSDFLLWV